MIELFKAKKDTTKLVKKIIIDKNGNQKTVYVKPLDVPKSNWLQSFMSFFKFKEKSQAENKVKQDYVDNNIKDKFGASLLSWKNHVAEYWKNKLKWDNHFQKKEQGKTHTGSTKTGAGVKQSIAANVGAGVTNINSAKFDAKLMFFIYNLYRSDKQNEKTGNTTDATGVRPAAVSAINKPVLSGGTQGHSLSDVPERKPADNGKVNVFSGGGTGERSGRNVSRLTAGQIKDLRQSILDLLKNKADNEMTEEDKELLRQYEGAGGIKEENRSTHGVLYEFYTPKNVVNKVWQLAGKYLGDGKKEILEPSAGTGRFAENKDHSFTMFEVDPTSARINKILNPNAEVLNKPFQSLFMPGGIFKANYTGKKFDAIVGNPPYGQYSGIEKGKGEGKDHKRYEEYFIERGLDALKEGGVMAYVVPSAFLRGAAYTSIKQKIAEKGKLLEAYRLPNGTFSTTDVGTDILIIRKEKGNVNDFIGNKYFQDNPDHILGDQAVRTGKFGPEQYVSLKAGDTFDSVLDQINPDAVPVVPVGQPTMTEEVKQKIAVGMKGNQNAKKLVTKEPEKKQPEPTVASPKVLDTIETFNAKYNKKIKPEEINIWKNTNYNGIINMGALSPKDRKYCETNDNICLYHNEYVHAINYASGNIYDKLNELEAEKGSMPEDKYIKQKALLEAAIPERKTVKNFSISPITEFAKNYEFSGEQYKTTDNTFSLIGRFFQWATGENRGRHYQNWQGGVTRHDIPSGISWSDIVDYVEQNSVRADSRGDKETNQQIAAKKRELRRDVAEKLFKRFIEDGLTPEEQKKLEADYNYRFNSYKAPDFAAIPVFVDGISTTFKGKELEIKEKQIQGVSFLCNKGNGILAHGVGVGKTIEGIIATVNQLQTGRASRPIICVPKAVYTNWIKEIRELFPDVKINELGNMRNLPPDLKIPEKTLSISTYEGLENITFKEDTINGDLMFDMLEAQATDTKSDRDEAKMKEKIYEKLGMAVKTENAIGIAAEALPIDDNNFETMPDGKEKNKKKESSAYYLEDLGFDHITIDELHNMKNIFAQAKPSKSPSGKQVANEFQGLNGGESARGLKLFAITQVIQKNNNDRNVFGLSATPFTNSPLEIYNILSLVARKRLKSLGIYNLHEFMAQYAKLKSEWAIKSNGQIERKNVMKEFSNLSALQNLIREYIDKVDGEEAGVKRPTKNTHLAEVEMTPTQKAIYAIEMERFNQKGEGGKPVPGATLKAINNLRMASLSPKLIKMDGDPLYDGTEVKKMIQDEDFVEDSPKLKFTTNSMAEFYNNRKDLGQVLYMPRGVENFKQVIDNLVKKGIPRDAIATISGETKEDAKEKIMKDFNNKDGKIKVIIGSETIKEGVNLNGNTAVLYNTLLGWNPSETVQVEGRIWRQGNKQGQIHVVYPQLIDSVDAAMYQKHDEKKQRFDALWSYKGDALNVEDINPEELKFELIKDPERRAKFVMDMKIEDIDNQKRGKRIFIDRLNKFKSDYSENESKIRRYKEKLPQIDNEIKEAEKDVEKAELEFKEYKAKTSKSNPDYDREINYMERNTRWAKDRLQDSKKSFKTAQKEIVLAEEINTGIKERLNGMGIEFGKTDERVKKEELELEQMFNEQEEIKKNKEQYILEAKKQIEASKKTVPPIRETVKNTVKLMLGNLKPMEELAKAIKLSISSLFIKKFDTDSATFKYRRLN